MSLAVVVAANVLIDPQRMFGLELFPNKRNENLRYAQYLAYRKVEPSIGGLMFASSRGSGIPLDVLSARTGGVRYADFTVGAGMITDHLPVLERAIRDKAARGERLKQVFLLLDVDLLGERPTTNRNPQTQLHPDLTGEDPVRFWVRISPQSSSAPGATTCAARRCRRVPTSTSPLSSSRRYRAFASRRSDRCHCRYRRSRCGSPRGLTISASSD